MRLQGRIISVDIETGGNFLAVAANPGDLTLTLNYSDEFDETGGTLYLGEPEVVRVYDSADHANNLIYLNALTPVGVSAEEGMFVGVLPGAEIKWANVETTPGLDTIPVRVPYTMNALIKPGMRDDTTGFEMIGFEKDGGDYVIKEVYNKAAVLDGTAIDEIPADLLSDGIPPAFSPGVTILPLGVGGLTGAWDPAPQPDIHDPVIYDVYVSATSPVTAIADNFLTSTGALSASFSTVKIAGVDTPIDTEVPSYMAVWARDSDGQAPSMGGEGSGIPRKADIEELNVEDLYANTIQTLGIWAQNVTTDVAFIGQSLRVGPANASHIDIVPSGPNAGLTLFGTDGTTPLIHLDMTIAQLSKFTGLLETEYITAVKMELTGTLSKIMSAAVLTIASSTISPPSSPPTVNQATSTRLWAGTPAGFTETGIWWDGTVWWQLIYNSSTFEARVRSIDAAGTATTSITLADDGSGRDVRGLYVDATYVWIIRRNSATAGSGVFSLRKFLLSDGSAVLDTAAAPILSYSSQFGNKTELFTHSLASITVSPSTGDIYTLDENEIVRKFNSSYSYQSQYTLPVSLTYGSEFRMSADSSGNLYIPDYYGHCIRKIDPSGTLLLVIGASELSSPVAVALDSTGNIFVADSDRIFKFDSSGVYQSQFGSSGTGNGQFDNTVALDIDSSGNIYVADQDNYRVQKFNSSGTYITQFGTNGSGSGQFSEVTDLVVDSSGNIFVLDSDLNRVQKFTSSGSYVTGYGTLGTGNGQFSSATNITINSSAEVFVYDRPFGYPRVQKFDTSNAYVSSFVPDGGETVGFSSNILGSVVDSSGNVHLVDFDNDRVMKYNSSGVYQSQFGTRGAGNGQFVAPRDITVDSSGNLYVTDAGNNRVQKFNSSGVYQSQFGTSGTGNGQFNNPYGITVDTSDNIYVVDSGNTRVQKFTSSGTYTSKFGSAGSTDGKFETMSAIAVDSSGNIWVADCQSAANLNRIQKFNSSGVFVSKFGSSGTGNGQFAPYIQIGGMSFDGAGNLYVADTGNNRVQKFTSSGTYVSQFGAFGSGNGQFKTPRDIVFSPSGDAYVVDSKNYRVQKYTATFPALAVAVATEVSPTIRVQPSLGYDGTSLLVGAVDKTSTVLSNTTLAGVVYYSKTTLAYTGTKATLASGNIITSETTTYVGVGNFDYGGNRLVIAGTSTVKVYTISSGVLTLDTSYPSWTFDGTSKAAGWDGTRFYSASGITTLTKYSIFKATTTAQRRFWAQYTFEDAGGLGLTPSPMASSLDLLDRRFINITVPGPIVGTTVTRVFTGVGTTAPANSAMYSRGTTAVAGTLQFESAAVSGLNPKTVSDLASGAPGLLKSQAGGFQVDGDGKGTWPLRDDRILPTLANATTTSETVVAQWTIPGGTFTAGQLARLTVLAQLSSTATLTWRIRMGAAGTTADALVIAFQTGPASTGTNSHIMFEGIVYCITAGSSGTISAGGFASNGIDLGDGVGPASGAFAPATVDTTVSRILSVTCQQSAANTLTTHAAMFEKHRG